MQPSPSPTKEVELITTPPSTLFFVLISIVVVSLTFGLGSTLTIEHARQTLKTKLPPFIAICCQYGIMPLTAFTLATIFDFSPAMSFGLLLCGAVPGGQTSNLFTYYIGGDGINKNTKQYQQITNTLHVTDVYAFDQNKEIKKRFNISDCMTLIRCVFKYEYINLVGLSIFMTVASVLCAIAFIPLIIFIYGPPLLKNADDDDIDIELPYFNIITSLCLVVFPTSAGIFLRSKSEIWAIRAENVGSFLGALFILGALISGIFENSKLFNSSWEIWIASLLLSVIGFFSGFICGKLCQLTTLVSLTIGLEVGIQNTILSILIAYVTFKDSSPKILNDALLFPLMCSFWDIVNSVVFLFIVKSNLFGKLSDDDDNDVIESKATSTIRLQEDIDRGRLDDADEDSTSFQSTQVKSIQMNYSNAVP